MLTREQLYDLIWSEPAKNLAPRFGISDVALSKACKRYHIPQPPRGYWAKLAAGKKVSQVPLPPRGLGIRERIAFGRTDTWSSYRLPKDLLSLEIGPAPTFDEPISEVHNRARAAVGKVTIPRDHFKAHHAIRALLEADNERREEYVSEKYPSMFDAPLFDSAFEKRRLRMINALMLALANAGARPSLSGGKDPTGFSVTIGHQSLSVTVDQPGYERHGWRRDNEMNKPASDKLRIEIGLGGNEIQTIWEDAPKKRVESEIQEIVVAILVAGELAYRRHELHQHEWLVSQKLRLIEEQKRARAEEERRATEKREAEERARVDRLLRDADDHRRANDIRAYVDIVLGNGAVNSSDSPERQLAWSKWALAQADRLDPLTSGRWAEEVPITSETAL